MTAAEQMISAWPEVEHSAPERWSLHALLLGLAGRVGDEALAEMRLCLADGVDVDLDQPGRRDAVGVARQP